MDCVGTGLYTSLYMHCNFLTNRISYTHFSQKDIVGDLGIILTSHFPQLDFIQAAYSLMLRINCTLFSTSDLVAMVIDS